MELVTEKEVKLLQELRGRIVDLNLSPELDQDKNLVRWLRARKQNVGDAEQMLRKNHSWLKDNDLENLVTTPDPPGWGQSGQFPWNFLGYDKDGNTVSLLRLGEWDVRSVMTSGNGDKDKFEKYCLKMMELAYRASVQCSKGKPWMGQFLIIYDFKGLSFSQVSCLQAIQVTMKLAQIFDSNYPELLRKGFVLHAPYPFQILFKLVGPVIEERTYNKLSLLGSDPVIWRKEIGALIPLDQFPAIYGGDGGNELNMTLGPDGCPCKQVM